MRFRKVTVAAFAALAVSWVAVATAAEQSSYVIPDVGPKNMQTLVDSYFNPAFRALAACSWGTSAPANGPSAAPIVYQCWADTTTNPVVFKNFDGASWVVFGKLNTSLHIWTPSYQGTDLGTASTATTGTSGHTVPFLDGINTISGAWSFNSGDLKLNGGSSGAGTLNAPAAASTFVWTLPSATDTLVGLGTTDTLTHKTFVCANQTSCVVRIGTDISGLGTGVATALAVNVGSAGAAVVNGGALGTPSSGVGTNLTGTAAGLTAGNVTTNANLTGDVTSVGNATTLTNAPVIAKVLTGFTSSVGTVTATDSILSAIQKVYGNDALKLPLAGGTMSGNIAMGGNAITGGGAITGTMITGTSYVGIPSATNAALGLMRGDGGATISCISGVCSAVGSAATAVTLGTTTATGGTAGNVLSVTNTGCSGTTPCLAQFSPAPITNSLGSNVTLNNISNYFDGPSIAQGTTGTWDASGGVTISSGTFGDSISCKLWDGTTVIDSRSVDVPVASFTVTMFLSGQITSPSANIRISCRDPNSTTAIMVANRSGNAKDSSVNAHRIQ